MSNITLDEIRPLLAREIVSRRGTLVMIFAITALIFLVMAFFWKKSYVSYAQIYVDDQRPVKSLLETDTGNDADQANLAKEELFNSAIMDRILDEVGFADENTSLSERERLVNEIQSDTEVFNINNQLIEILFEHHDPEIAFKTTSLYADLFLDKAMRQSTRETTENFELIVDQVETLRAKLEDSEARIQQFKSQYPGLGAATEGNVETRVIELRRELEQTQLQAAQAEQRSRALQREVDSESSTLARDAVMTQYRNRMFELQSQIESLRMSYTDDYPDIVRLKQQLQDLEFQSQQAATGSVTGLAGGNAVSPVFQQLRSDLALTKANAASLRSRANQLQVLLNKEIERSATTSKVEREYTDLVRDYERVKIQYNTLAQAQDDARIAMVVSSDKQGVLYRIAEPANFPQNPDGLRFIHIAVGGLLLSMLLPFAYLILFLKLDPRMRTASSITEVLELPLLATVPHMERRKERKAFLASTAGVITVVASVFVVYVVVALIKFATATNLIGGGVA